MKAYKCDRCGSLYESYTKIVLDERPKEHVTFSATSLVLRNSDLMPVGSYDLCPNCMRKVLTMLRGNKE
jgi:DNA-directed RNA polymerase subunit RPC12/RpoP